MVVALIIVPFEAAVPEPVTMAEITKIALVSESVKAMPEAVVSSEAPMFEMVLTGLVLVVFGVTLMTVMVAVPCSRLSRGQPRRSGHNRKNNREYPF